MIDATITFMNDRDIAKLVGFSPSWVKGQRFNRRHGKVHAFTVDPVLIGTSPRYRQQDILDWLAGLGS